MLLDASITESVSGVSLLKAGRAGARPYTCEEAELGCISCGAKCWVVGKGRWAAPCCCHACVCGPSFEVGEGYCLRRPSCFEGQGDLGLGVAGRARGNGR